jgi:hypothetical protein
VGQSAAAAHKLAAWRAIAKPTQAAGRLGAGVMAPNDLVPGSVATAD